MTRLLYNRDRLLSEPENTYARHDGNRHSLRPGSGAGR